MLTRVRDAVESDEQRLAELEDLFRWIDVDGDGQLRLEKLEAAATALGGSSADVTGTLLARIRAQAEDAPLGQGVRAAVGDDVLVRALLHAVPPQPKQRPVREEWAQPLVVKNVL